MDDLLERFDHLKDGVSRLKSYRDILVFQASEADTSEKEFKYSADLHQKCTEIFKTWLEDSLTKNVDSIAQLATTGLRHVLGDQELSFHIRQDPQKNRLAMRFVVEEDGNEGDPLASFGGGAAVVISLVLRLAVMARMGMGNLLLLDESMAALWNGYVPSCAEFMRQLSEQTGINILMVTHNPEFISNAHVAYEGHKDGSLKLRRVKSGGLGDGP
jgi:DNA repair exonuclease SbcCD ATPase subunit